MTSFDETTIPLEDDAFGPGSDLVLSLLAVMVLLLAVVGFGDLSSTPQKPTPEESSCESGDDCRKEEIDSQPPPAPSVEPVPLDPVDPSPSPAPALSPPREELVSLISRQRSVINGLRDRAPVVVGNYTVEARMLADWVETGQIGPPPAGVVAAINGDLASIWTRSYEIAFVGRTPAEILGLFPRSWTSSRALSQAYEASVALAGTFQQYYLERGLPLSCSQLHATGFRDYAGTIRVVGMSDQGVDRIQELRVLYDEISPERFGALPVAVTVMLVPSNSDECAGLGATSIFGAG